MEIHSYIAKRWNPELNGRTPEETKIIEELAPLVHELGFTKANGGCYEPNAT